MHGCSSTSVLLVDAEVDSMGGVVEGGVGIANKTSPRRAAIEKVQADLRQEYDVREKRKKEIEFLEKGGDPLEFFKFANAASVSVQSASCTDQNPDRFVTSEAKGSFAFTASPHGDSVESSGRLGAPREPNSADNLMLFDAEHESLEGDQNSLRPSRTNIVQSEQLSKMDVSNKTREHGDSAAFDPPRKSYKRRNRSRANRDSTRSISTDVNPTCGSHGSSEPSHHGPRDVKALISDAENKDISSNCCSKPTSSVDHAHQKTGLANSQQDMELDDGKAAEFTKNLIEGVPVDAVPDAIASETPLDNQCDQQSLSSAVKTPMQMNSDGPEAIQAMEEMTSADIECHPVVTATKVENQSISCQMNGSSSKKGDGLTSDAHNRDASRGIKGLNCESSCAHTSLTIDANNDSEMCNKMRKVDSNGNVINQTLVPDRTSVEEGDAILKEKKESGGVNSSTLVIVESASASQRENDCKLQPKEELNQSGSGLKDEKDQIFIEGMGACGPTGSESGRKPTNTLGNDPGPPKDNSCNVRLEDSIGISISDLPVGGSMTGVSNEVQTSFGPDSRLASNIDEDSILKEAKIIEAKRKRIAELSIGTSPTQVRPNSHWGYVLEEVAWLANDFAQERMWKIAAAAQISSRVAFACRLRKQESNSCMEAKKVAHTLAKTVMEFWRSAEETGKEQEQQSQKDGTLSVQAYAVRFLKYNNSNTFHDQVDVPLTPDRTSDLGILGSSWEDNLTEENLFYTVPPGAMKTYRKSIESHVAQLERIGSSLQEGVETSACDGLADFEPQDNAYDEDEGETSTYDMSMAFEGSTSLRFAQKKRKKLRVACGVRSYEIGPDLLPMQHAENNVVTQQSPLLAKRPGGSLNVSIPTKRVRTASRRVISPFTAGTSGYAQLPNKTDASSGDTNSFQDDQSTLRGGSHIPNSYEVESVGDFEKQLPFDPVEVSTKHKKKKKAKHLNDAYEPRWQVDSSFQNDQFQRDHLKKRSESHHLESNGSSGLLGQPMMKKPKIMRQSQDNSFDNITPIAGSLPSPAASQMSNMSNPNKFIKMLGGRDRGRKPKVLKMPAGQPGSGSLWSLFEDQALVVLAHDLGPNWELVSDAINSTLHFKCVFRKAKECKERHNFLMDRTSGDGADSAEDSGSSQPYPSTLPGIPKGSARQLFQRLQGPMEEDTLKSHFEKIIMIGQKHHYCKPQEPKQLQQPHGSHAFALSQVCPNNLNGGPFLTPLDLCDATISGPDTLSLGYQGPHSGGLAIPNHGTVPPTYPASGANTMLQGSPNMMLHNNLSSTVSLNSPVRDVRYGIPRSASLSADEQQRMQQYNHMISNRNIPQPNISAPGALAGTDRGVRVLPGGNGMGLVCGGNRSIPIPRPGFQGLASPSMVNSGSMVSPSMASAGIHSGGGSVQGSSMLRPRETLHIMRPGPSQMQVSPGNNQGASHFGGLSSPFPNQTASPSVSSYPVHHQPSHPSPQHPHFQGPPNHSPTPQQQAYAIHLAKERQLPQRLLQQQQPQQSQFAISSPIQNSSQVQPQTISPPVSVSPLTSSSSMSSMPQHQQKHQNQPNQGVVRVPQAVGSGLTNQAGKQRQRQQQQIQQTNRQHPQQPSKAAKGVGRGNPTTNQNVRIDPSVNGVSSNKGESASHLMQSQGLYPSSSPKFSNQPLPMQKKYSGQASSSSKHPHQMTSHSDNSSQSHVQAVTPASSPAIAGSNHQHQKLVNQNQRVVQPNRFDTSNKPQARDSNTDQPLTSSSAEVDKMAKLPQACNNSANVAHAVSSEPLLDPNALNSTKLSSVVSTPSNSNESVSQAGQGLGQQQPNSPLPQPRQQLHSQQQAKLLQAGNGDLYGRAGDHRLE
ncbi:hypothetical protein BUALT_Bualt13G0118900 [Buddleja alternifolia]|uniref:Uncharacterized protein n=1 Tax=Buddleja alternifolia TaxID=168488 RepID=A0AAV6WV60_9LAMI|nr:hypothetical protein BUALT_Bualt13G0118900 [Buddleja alternifolia]